MSFLYPRTVSIFRAAAIPAGSAGFGAQPYQEAAATLSTSVFATDPIFAGIACSIQQTSQGRGPSADLPADTKTTSIYRVFIPLRTLPLDAIRSRDFLVDDTGRRYHVTDPYWNSLGYNLLCMMLEV